MKLIYSISLVVWANIAFATPAKDIDKRATTVCGQWDTIVTGNYQVNNLLWGRDAATSGSQCTTLNSNSNNVISWSTSWSWAGGQYNVKSYADVQLNTNLGKQLKNIGSIQSKMKWSYTGSNIIGNVAYDLFTASTPKASKNQYEIMVWLGALGGAGPISSSGSPIAKPTINGVSWKLYSGSNGVQSVYSFVASSQINNWSGDMKAFFTYLINNHGFSSSQYLNVVQAGTEPFIGSNAKLSVSSYSASIN